MGRDSIQSLALERQNPRRRSSGILVLAMMFFYTRIDLVGIGGIEGAKPVLAVPVDQVAEYA